jgi:tRNA 2-thiouridine synthesizing protein A
MTERLDLRGVRCPLNWARAKVRIEDLARGAEIEILLDDPKGVRDIPRAAEAEGYAVLDVVRHDETAWRLLIQR